jgi:hypothetical protein
MRKTLPRRAALQVRQRLAAYVEQYYGGDWTAFRLAAGIDRGTVAGWHREGRGDKPLPVPDVISLVQLRARLGISIDWLLLGGLGPMLYDATSISDPAPQRFRATLVQYLGTAGPEVECWVGDKLVHNEQPRADHFDRVLPDADAVFKLAAELIRALLARPLHLLIDRERRRGKTIRVVKDQEAARQIEQELDAECESALQEWRENLTVLADYIQSANRSRRVPFQIISYDEQGNYTEAWPTLVRGRPDPGGRSAKKKKKRK